MERQNPGGDHGSKFNQKEIIEKSNLLKKKWPTGVCSVLVAEWLSAGGSLTQSRINQITNKGSAENRIDSGMSKGRRQMLEDYGLSNAGTLGPSKASSVLDQFQPFFIEGHAYYVKFGGEAGGHAIGVICEKGNYRVFDPNRGVKNFSSPVAMYIHVLELLNDYMDDGLDEVEVERLNKPSWRSGKG